MNFHEFFFVFQFIYSFDCWWQAATAPKQKVAENQSWFNSFICTAIRLTHTPRMYTHIKSNNTIKSVSRKNGLVLFEVCLTRAFTTAHCAWSECIMYRTRNYCVCLSLVLRVPSTIFSSIQSGFVCKNMIEWTHKINAQQKREKRKWARAGARIVALLCVISNIFQWHTYTQFS